MRPFRALILVSLASLSAVAVARPPALDPLIEAAGRGELAPIERALAEATDAHVRAVLRAGLAAARLDPAAVDDPAVARAMAAADPELRRAALAIAASAAFAEGRYAKSAYSGRLLEQSLVAAGKSERAAEAARMVAVAELLAGSPSQAIEGVVNPARAAGHYDRVGLPRTSILVNGQAQEAVVDTGASLSVLSRDTARRLGVEVLDAAAEVTNGVQGTVPVRVGVADRLEIAGTVFRHVAFLVIDDEQLTFPIPGGYDIRAIVGLPVLKALGRVGIERGGDFLVRPPAERAASGARLSASANDLFVEVEIAGEAFPLHLDTGAGQTFLGPLYAQARPAAIAGLAQHDQRSASAGGARTVRAAAWPDPPLVLGGHRLPLASVIVNLPGDGPASRYYGTVGSDALRAFAAYVIDFGAMRVELGRPAEPASEAS